MTKSVQRLELELGATLFERTAQGIALTRAGKAFLSRAKAATHELRRGEEEVSALSGGTGGTLSFAISAASSLLLAAPVISDFLRQHPDVQMRIVGGVYSTVLPQLREGLLDFSIGPRPHEIDDAFTATDLFRSERVVVARKGHPLEKCTSLKDLLTAQWLISGASGLDFSNHAEAFQQHGLTPPPIRAQSDYVPIYLSLLAATDMVMILPRLWIHSPMTDDRLVAIPIREALPSVDICVVRRKGLGPTPVAEALLRQISRAAEHYMRERLEAGDV